MYTSPQSLSSKNKLSDAICDSRSNPDEIAYLLSISDLPTQSAMFEISMNFIKHLSIQASSSYYVNDNMSIAIRARQIYEHLLTYQYPM